MIEQLAAPVRGVSALMATAIPERVDERGERYTVDVEDTSHALLKLEGGAVGVITNSWASRVRRDDTMMVQIDGTPQTLRVNEAESPLAGLARLKDKGGEPFLPAEALAAGERLHADFTRAQLQPRVTASWQPRLSGRTRGERGGMADLADSAIAARIAVNRAIEAMGPELAGAALDICCFMKGLETVERERQWPVRSAKLMLRTALLALARHYNPPRRSARMQHWGEEGYRPGMETWPA